MTSKQTTYSSIQAEPVKVEKIMVEVIAPANLKAGYKFNAQYEGVVFPVVVPKGGVVQGQKVMVPFDPNVSYVAASVTGMWKDGLFDCTQKGLCHPSLICACFYKCILLGQVMTRLKLDWLARPASDEDFKKTFKILVSIQITFFILLNGLSPTDPAEEETSPMYYFVCGVFFAFMVIIMTSVRKVVRENYQIPEQNCIGCEDFCCAFWCSCCTISQLARQTPSRLRCSKGRIVHKKRWFRTEYWYNSGDHSITTEIELGILFINRHNT